MTTRVFIGFDPRQPLGYNVLQHSIRNHAAGRVHIEALELRKLPITRRGLTEFTYSRFLVPWLCDYEGVAIFMDADIVVQGDVADLVTCVDGSADVYVAQGQPKFEWPSVMVFDCANCQLLTPAFVEDKSNSLLSLDWGKVGEIPAEWNHCVGYQEWKEAKLYHYTQGLPCWPETQGLVEDAAWVDEFKDMARTCSWRELMLNSVHAKPVLIRMMERYGIRLDGVAKS